MTAQNSKQEKLKLHLNVFIFIIFQSKPKPTQADLYESNNSQNRYEPSTKPPINYKAPSIAFQLPEINDALEPERVKGGLISESFSIWLKSPKKRCQISLAEELVLYGKLDFG